MLTSSAGTSSLNLAIEVGVSQKTAWMMMHADWKMMDLQDEIGPALKGIVEIDEKYGGGKPCERKGVVNKRSIGAKKAPVLVIVQRRGPVLIYPIAKDSFDIIAPEFAGHSFVKHNGNEFARGVVHNNTAESVNAIMEKVNKDVYH